MSIYLYGKQARDIAAETASVMHAAAAITALGNIHPHLNGDTQPLAALLTAIIHLRHTRPDSVEQYNALQTVWDRTVDLSRPFSVEQR